MSSSSAGEETPTLSIGGFGAGTGVAAALSATVARPDRIRAVVSRGGRPDLVTGALPDVKAPTLLIVGGKDRPVLELNQHALGELRCEKHLEPPPPRGDDRP